MFESPSTNSDEYKKKKKKTRLATVKLFALHANTKCENKDEQVI